MNATEVSVIVECSVENCTRDVHAGGMCNAHHLRLKRTGDVMAAVPINPRGLPIAQRLRDQSSRTNAGCLVWLGPRKDNGYGNFTIGRKRHLVHRVAYTEWVGQIPEGLQIDHLCRNRLCIEPTHLEAVTSSENLRRIPSRSKRKKAPCVHCGKSLGVNDMTKHVRRFHTPTEETDHG